MHGTLGVMLDIRHLVCYSERRLWHFTEELFCLTFALNFCFVPDSSGHAHTSVSHSAVLWRGVFCHGMGGPAPRKCKVNAKWCRPGKCCEHRPPDVAVVHQSLHVLNWIGWLVVLGLVPVDSPQQRVLCH